MGNGTDFDIGLETVGYSSYNQVWTQQDLDGAVEASLNATTDDDIIRGFIETITG